MVENKSKFVFNRMEPEIQMQHRLPKVYLKRFGYRENGRRYITVLEKNKNKTEQKDIETFTAEANIFDYSILPDIKERRHFENLCNKLETQYPNIIESIKKGSLLSEQWAILCQFIATLIARSGSTRIFYSDLVQRVDTKKKFFDEITIFNEEYRSHLDVFAWEYSPEETIRFISVVAGEHIAKCLSKFSYVVLKAPRNTGKKWFTSDDPVVIDKQGEYGYLIPIEAEIYFPITKDYCLFVYHKKSKIQNHPLRELEAQKVHECDEVSHAYISMQIIHNAYKYTLLPEKLEVTFAEPIPISKLRLLRI
jgi:hypothetical protein